MGGRARMPMRGAPGNPAYAKGHGYAGVPHAHAKGPTYSTAQVQSARRRLALQRDAIKRAKQQPEKAPDPLLPPEVVEMILDQLDLIQVSGVLRVCKQWLALARRRKAVNLSFRTDLTNQSIEKFFSTISLPRIIALNLAGCHKLTDFGLEKLSSLSNLEILDMSFCPKITDKSFLQLSHLSNLKKLDIFECQISDRGAEAFKHLEHSLTRLMLHGCMRLTDQGMPNIENLHSLKVLSLSNCFGITDNGAHRIPLQNLTRLYLSRGRITDNYLAQLTQAKQLTVLDLSFCDSLTDNGMRFLCQIKTISVLSVSGCSSISNEGADFFVHMNNLEELSMAWLDKITDAVIHRVLGLKKLKMLDICGCTQVTNAIKPDISQGRKI
eukprot:CAMPEP_0168534278 /NCGR_PEP_ID=MMETSP0405-20121227/17772_1 /TAXON_ID=498012 /ORGANISM="Trichosphaerium sp, Strain Am-I-7 wt" /LENGTH=381 /DNA_ID=CAMNT_0008560889 /DNA_START=98 /DNA_END=1240 /DNA_ORIENTATION=-